MQVVLLTIPSVTYIRKDYCHWFSHRKVEEVAWLPFQNKVSIVFNLIIINSNNRQRKFLLEEKKNFFVLGQIILFSKTHKLRSFQWKLATFMKNKINKLMLNWASFSFSNKIVLDFDNKVRFDFNSSFSSWVLVPNPAGWIVKNYDCNG